MPNDLPEKLPLASPDIAAEKRDALHKALAATFPEAVADGTINFDELRRALGHWVEPDRERFGLNWPGKAACMRVIQAPSIGTLKPTPEESLDWNTTKNAFIEGDNLEVLKLLQKAYFGKIKLIYIDPPYNTGKEFIYPDKYSESLDTYLEYTGQKDSGGRRFSTNTDSSGRYHSRWLNMMYPRLYLAKNLLREDGAIFISIDDHEVTNLEQVCDQIFGSENHIGTIPVINNLKGRNDKANIATCHEYLVVYGRPQFASYGLPLNEEQLAAYKFSDEKRRKYALRDLRKRGNQDKREDRPKMYFPIFYNKTTGKCSLERHDADDVEIFPKLGDGRDGRWRWGIDKVAKNIDFLHPKYNKSKSKWGIEHRVYLDPSVQPDDNDDEEADDEDMLFDRTSKPKSFWWGAEISTDIASREFKELFPEITGDYPKSPYLVEKVIRMSTKPGDVILDFFAGYSTTAHAAFVLNCSEREDRHFIMVQLPEQCPSDSEEHKAGFGNIAQISRERIRRASEKFRSRLGDQDGPNSHDFGFRAFSLSRSCFNVWNSDTEGLDQPTLLGRLTAHADHLASSADTQSVLYELLLKDGFEMTVAITQLTLANKAVHSIADGALLICLDKQLTQEVIDAMADLEPSRVICLDAGFQGNDQLKANAVQTFKARARNTETAIEFRTV